MPWGRIAQWLAILALVICFLLPTLVLVGRMELATYQYWFGWATLLWFLAAPFWMAPDIFRRPSSAAGGSGGESPHSAR